MGKYNFDRIIERKGTDSVKYDLEVSMPHAPKDSLPLWIADMDFACAPKIIEALHKRIDREIFGYSKFSTDAYFGAVCGWFKRRFNWDINREAIVYSPGVVPAFSFLIQMLVEEGEGVIIQKPVYYPFEEKIKANNRKLVNNALKFENNKYVMDYENFEELAKDPNNKLFILCSPHNPVGRVWDEEELRKIVDICRENNLWIISDEIHCDITRKGINHKPLEVVCPDYKDKIITCTAPSKTFNLAGMQLSNIIINNIEIREKWVERIYGAINLHDPNPFAIEAIKTAYNDCEDWLDEVNEYIDDNIDYIENFIKENLPKVKMTKPEGTYLVWLDFREYGLSGKELEEIMVYKAKVLFDEGYIFGVEGDGFERINVAAPRSIIEECMRRIKTGLELVESSSLI
ncbi:MalY/PatB family protein [Terrisporobacter sp.]|uniref:MalY/PatB family protein n=1 Tax=Terrisporobacter sp. TaxID=1965305 RepID=UPI002604DEC1|nr:MalY/PatB family protein [Terrisporobacter sp.]